MKHIDCNLCNSNNYAEFLEVPGKQGGNFKLVKCNSCGLVFMNPCPSQSDQIDYYCEDYSPTYKKDIEESPSLSNWLKKQILIHYYGYSHLDKGIKSWLVFSRLITIFLFPFYLRQVLIGKDISIVPYCGEGKILDIGSGEGAFLYKLKRLGWKACGIEANRKIANFAREKLGLDVITGDFDKLDLAENFYDVVYMAHVLEHLPDPTGTLRKVNRILKNNGMVIVRVPNIDSVRAYRQKENWGLLDAPRHLYHFSPETIRLMLEKAGFKVKKIRHDFTNLGRSGNKNRFIRKLMKFANFWSAVLHKSEVIVVTAVKK